MECNIGFANNATHSVLLIPKNATTSIHNIMGVERSNVADHDIIHVLIRDPYERFLSSYHEVRRRHKYKDRFNNNDESIESYIDDYLKYGPWDQHQLLQFDHVLATVDLYPNHHYVFHNFESIDDFEKTLDIPMTLNLNATKTHETFTVDQRRRVTKALLPDIRLYNDSLN